MGRSVWDLGVDLTQVQTGDLAARRPGGHITQADLESAQVSCIQTFTNQRFFHMVQAIRYITSTKPMAKLSDASTGASPEA